MALEKLDPNKTALVVIDLQNGIVGLPCQPHPSSRVVANAAALAGAFRSAGALVALVRVASKDGKDFPTPLLDQPAKPRGSMNSKDAAEIVAEIGVQDTDYLITKHQWGAFYGTELDLQLRRRGIEQIVLCGIATGYGVDTTAREAYQHGYNQIFVEDAMSGLSEEEHKYVLKYIFPRIGLIRSTDEVLKLLGTSAE